MVANCPRCGNELRSKHNVYEYLLWCNNCKNKIEIYNPKGGVLTARVIVENDNKNMEGYKDHTAYEAIKNVGDNR